MSIDLERYKPPQQRSRWGKAGRFAWGVGLTIGLFVVSYLGVKWLAGEVSNVIAGPEKTTIASGIEIEFTVTPGAPASQIARDLADAGIVESASAFDRVVREQRASDRLQAGTYALETGMDPDDVLDVLLAGPETEVYRLTVVEGLTVGQMLESVERQTDFTFDDLSRLLLDGSVTSTLAPSQPESLQDWEGLLFPDTYEFRSDATAVDVLERLTSTAEDRVGSIDWTYYEDRDLTPYDGLIIASLIEREAFLDEDRPLIASVIFNRLDLGMKLQIDATVVYALGGTPPGGLTVDDLEVNSPYNTYLIDGLPPTPISGVGIASLRAAAMPAETDYLYYIALGEDGGHQFTADFDEFLRWQQEAAGAP